MTPELSTAIISLALIIIGSIGALIKAMVDRVLIDLAHNTQITNQAKDAANGRLDAARHELARERDHVLALRALVRERDNRLAFIEARLPAVTELMKTYGQRREDSKTESEENRVLASLLEDIDMQNRKH